MPTHHTTSEFSPYQTVSTNSNFSMLLSSIRDFSSHTGFQLYAWTDPHRLDTEKIAHPTQCAWRSQKYFIIQSQADVRDYSRRFFLCVPALQRRIVWTKSNSFSSFK